MKANTYRLLESIDFVDFSSIDGVVEVRQNKRPGKNLYEVMDGDVYTDASNSFSDGSKDFCEVCNRGGSLMICDKCPRVYHLRCIGLRVLPAGEWFCPHCDGGEASKKRGSSRKKADAGPVVSSDSGSEDSESEEEDSGAAGAEARDRKQLRSAGSGLQGMLHGDYFSDRGRVVRPSERKWKILFM